MTSGNDLILKMKRSEGLFDLGGIFNKVFEKEEVLGLIYEILSMWCFRS